MNPTQELAHVYTTQPTRGAVQVTIPILDGHYMRLQY